MLDARVKDWTSETFAAPTERSYSTLVRAFLLFASVAALVWLCLFAAYKRLPYVQNGSQALSEEKWAIARSGSVFGRADRLRIVAFGNSKTLAGFRSDVFDRAAGSGIASYNFAIPGEERFVGLLAAMLEAGTRPTHVLVQQLPDYDEPGLLDRLRNDKPIVNWLFPFRGFVRDLIVFVYESRRAGGLAAQYRENAAQVARFIGERGYFFIKSQSHFAGDRLPDGYSLPTDKPNEVPPRRIRPEAESFKHLMALADRYDFSVVLVPVSHRRGESAPPPEQDADAAAKLAAYPRVRVVGPAYWLQPVSEFSDPVHLNVPGADVYSDRLAALLRPTLQRGN